MVSVIVEVAQANETNTGSAGEKEWRKLSLLCDAIKVLGVVKGSARNKPFLDAPSHLYKRSCPSVRPSEGWSRVIFEGEKYAY